MHLFSKLFGSVCGLDFALTMSEERAADLDSASLSAAYEDDNFGDVGGGSSLSRSCSMVTSVSAIGSLGKDRKPVAYVHLSCFTFK